MAKLLNPQIIFSKNSQEYSWVKRSFFFFAIFLMPLIHLCLKFTDVNTTYNFLKLISPQPILSLNSIEKAKEINQIVELTANLYPRWGKCLRKSFLLWYLLRIQRIDSNLVIGARQQEGKFQSHAWVEIQGELINEIQQEKQSYQVLVVK
jgi:hypothetical protein